MTSQDEKKEKLSIGAMIESIFSAFLGVRDSKKGNDDFAKGSPVVFVVAGIVATLSFILLLVLIVTLIVP
ncbi:MAG: DUF2970 domain-containing protein [Gammaproteobacteria bacterium]|jgi:hypothetical protein|nr:DUF2970 domain-containing protein [Gammaproteobacteria bacterium]